MHLARLVDLIFLKFFVRSLFLRILWLLEKRKEEVAGLDEVNNFLGESFGTSAGTLC